MAFPLALTFPLRFPRVFWIVSVEISEFSLSAFVSLLESITISGNVKRGPGRIGSRPKLTPYLPCLAPPALPCLALPCPAAPCRALPGPAVIVFNHFFSLLSSAFFIHPSLLPAAGGPHAE